MCVYTENDQSPSAADVSRLESMMRDCQQMVGLHDDSLRPVVAASCFDDVTLGCPYWLVYSCTATEQCLKSYFDERRLAGEVQSEILPAFPGI